MHFSSFQWGNRTCTETWCWCVLSSFHMQFDKQLWKELKAWSQMKLSLLQWIALRSRAWYGGNPEAVLFWKNREQGEASSVSLSKNEVSRKSHRMTCIPDIKLWRADFWRLPNSCEMKHNKAWCKWSSEKTMIHSYCCLLHI